MKELINKFFFIFILVISLLLVQPLFADETKTIFDCTLTDQVSDSGDAGDAKDSFSPSTDKLYLVCSSDQVKKGDTVKATWIAVDTNNVAPANYKIDEKTLSVDQNVADGQDYIANMSISKPNNGWPAGKYRVDFYVNGRLDQSTDFSIEKS